MQALSLRWHIVIVCFGVAFPAIVVFMEGLWLRTGDPLYQALAKRWSKAMIALFAVGVVSGTILSFELGVLWPEFMATFIAIYVYGWDRLSPRVHLLTGIPVVITGITGSLFVLSAPRATLVAVLVAFLVGALVLVPSLAYLFRLVLQGRLAKDLPPLSRERGGGPVP